MCTQYIDNCLSMYTLYHMCFPYKQVNGKCPYVYTFDLKMSLSINSIYIQLSLYIRNMSYLQLSVFVHSVSTISVSISAVPSVHIVYLQLSLYAYALLRNICVTVFPMHY